MSNLETKQATKDKMDFPDILLSIIGKKRILFVVDICFIFVAYLWSLLFRFGGIVPDYFMESFKGMIVPLIITYTACNFLFHLYSSLWRYASIDEILHIFYSIIIATMVVYIYSVITDNKLPRSLFFTSGAILLTLFGGVRLSFRFFRRFSNAGAYKASKKIFILIVGAGYTGATILKQIHETGYNHLVPVGFVDDNAKMKGSRIDGLKILGATNDIPSLVEKYAIEQIIFAVPSATPAAQRRILEICTQTNCELKIIPRIESMLEGVNISRIRDVDICDLLPREEVTLNAQAISEYLKGCIVLVTGGGGSIGSELCRQIAKFKPKQIVIFDIYENNAYELQMDLLREYGVLLDIIVVIGSVRDMKRVDAVFAEYKPDVVFHAAAHKHVPLMEISPSEAVKNNVNGTFIVTKAADLAGVKRVVLISSDKAVNPANVMGATKYLCELIVQYMNQKSTNTQYVAVRFGNVLGSNGSVIPLFRKQIAAGGPVTVTHKDMTRYFMTIPEAAQLVLQAGALANQGEIFLLDMGEPVNIDDFARRFIRLSGFTPDVDINVVYTGLRPGEKMYEELMQSCEMIGQSSFKGIMICKTHQIDASEIKRRIDHLRQMVAMHPEKTSEYLEEAVPSYKKQK